MTFKFIAFNKFGIWIYSTLLCIFFSSANAWAIGSVASFTASKSSMSVGQTTTLSWQKPANYSGTVKYNVSVTKPDGGSVRFLSGVTKTSHARTINLAGRHTFYVQACDSSGNCGSWRTTAVTVYAKPGISSFNASRRTMSVGDTTTLSWSKASSYSGAVTYKVSVLKPDGGNVLFLNGVTKTSHGRTISLAGTHTYYVQACNPAGGCGSSRSVSVTVYAKPSLASFSVSPSTLSVADSTTLSWNKSSSFSGSVTYKVSVKKPDGSNILFLDGVTQTSHMRTIELAGTHTFYAQACNAAGGCGAQRTASVTVYDKPSVDSFSASPSTLPFGENTRLSWSVPGEFNAPATYKVRVEKPDGENVLFLDGVSQTSHDRRISLVGTHTFYVSACNLAGGCGSERQTAVLVNGPDVASFDASPSTISVGETTTLSWSMSAGFSDAVTYKVRVEKPDGGNVLFLDGVTQTSHDRSILLAGTHLYYVKACSLSGDCGSERQVTVDVVAGDVNWSSESVVTGQPVSITGIDAAAVSCASGDISFVPTVSGSVIFYQASEQALTEWQCIDQDAALIQQFHASLKIDRLKAPANLRAN